MIRVADVSIHEREKMHLIQIAVSMCRCIWPWIDPYHAFLLYSSSGSEPLVWECWVMVFYGEFSGPFTAGLFTLPIDPFSKSRGVVG